MQITLSLDDALLRDLRRLAERHGVALEVIVEQALRAGRAQLEQPRKGVPNRARTFSLGTPQVDLDKALGVAASLGDEAAVNRVSDE